MTTPPATNTSVYVDFEAGDGAAVYAAFGIDEEQREAEDLGQTPSFMIWTTTPWTLPANLAIAVTRPVERALGLPRHDVMWIGRAMVATLCTLSLLWLYLAAARLFDRRVGVPLRRVSRLGVRGPRRGGGGVTCRSSADRSGPLTPGRGARLDAPPIFARSGGKDWEWTAVFPLDCPR